MDAQVQFPEHGGGAETPPDWSPESPEPDEPGPVECPMCREEARPGAIKCRHCGTLLAHFRICSRCAEKVHEDAAVCHHCGLDFGHETERLRLVSALNANPHRLAANPVGALLTEMSLTGLFFPPEIEIRGDEVLLRRWSLLGLRRLDQRISTKRIASARYLRGIIWGGLMIETFGGALSDLVMHGLDRDRASETAELLERLVANA